MYGTGNSFGFNCGNSVIVMAIAVALAICGLQRPIRAAPQEDLVRILPGQPPVSFKQYAGYVTLDKSKNRALFYYLVEAEADPASKPLVVWLNGGPGCSSFGVGALSEHGPFQPRGSKLIRNNYSWNKEANMLYVETPVGVGFSYSADEDFYRSVNDSVTAEDNLTFLRGWLNKFPEYKTRDLYLTGESYAGHYIPQWANLIVSANKREKIFNLKGIAIGNPLLEFFTDTNSRGEFLWSHGLISDAAYAAMENVCNYSRYMDIAYRNEFDPDCIGVYDRVSSEVSKFIDRYDVTLDICLSSLEMQTKALKIKKIGGTEPDVCVQDEASTYLNMRSVQTALHARLVGSVKSWQACSDVLEYDQLNMEIPTVGLLGNLVESGVRVLVYSGDQDSIIPLTGTRSLINKLAESLKLNTTVPYSVWFEGKQVGGWTQVYGGLLTFATLRGASHEAPFSQPERSLRLFSTFLSGQPLPSNSTSVV